MLDQIIGWLSQPWKLFSVAAQIVFFLRFFVQWLSSERKGRTVVPDAFWTFSIVGGGMLTLYFVHNGDWAPAVGQMGGLAIYLRNVYLIQRNRRRSGSQATAEARVLAEDLRSAIGRCKDIRDRPVAIDETLERLKALLQPGEVETL